MSTFFHNLSFSEYRYWDAIYWRTGYLDRGQSATGYPVIDQVRYAFLEQISDTIGRERPDHAEVRARALADYSDRRSLWFLVARKWGMRDHMILTFETNRTRSIDSVRLEGKQELRHRYHSRDPRVAAGAREELASWASGPGVTVPDMEAVLGRPYYELLLGVLDAETKEAVQQSVDAATDDIIEEATRLMAQLHVRPYVFWTSETELMIAAARPGSARGPWNRQDVERAAPLVSAAGGVAAGANSSGLIEWSNARRSAYEPECNWQVITADDVRLVDYLAALPALKSLLDFESWTGDDEELLRRLTRLGRFGYGLPQVRKPEYRNVHTLE